MLTWYRFENVCTYPYLKQLVKGIEGWVTI